MAPYHEQDVERMVEVIISPNETMYIQLDYPMDSFTKQELIEAIIENLARWAGLFISNETASFECLQPHHVPARTDRAKYAPILKNYSGNPIRFDIDLPWGAWTNHYLSNDLPTHKWITVHDYVHLDEDELCRAYRDYLDHGGFPTCDIWSWTIARCLAYIGEDESPVLSDEYALTGYDGHVYAINFYNFQVRRLPL